jgi:hypothetical protein
MLISNMIVLLRKSFILIVKTEIYRQNFSYLTQNLEKINFLSNQTISKDTRFLLEV